MKTLASAIKGLATSRADWIVLSLLLVGFLFLEPQGILVSAVAVAGAVMLFVVAKRGHSINTGRVSHGVSQQIITLSPGMYIVVYDLHSTEFAEYLSDALGLLTDKGLQAVTLGTGFLTAFFSSVTNNTPAVLIGALSTSGNMATGVVKEATICASAIGCDLGPKIAPIDSLVTLLWLRVLAQKNMTITWGHYFRTGTVMIVPVLFVILAVLAWRLFVIL